MDFKNRFPNRLTEGSRDPNYGIASKPTSNNNPFANAFSRQSTQSLRPTKPAVSVQSTGLNKFKKAPSTGAAPKGQFKKYMVQANNIFYQDRPELKQLQQVKMCKWALILLWLLLAGSYFLIRRITPYDGVCPPRAKCGVFVRCPELFEYHKATNECRLSSDFLEEIEYAARNRVKQLQLEYGQRECLQQDGAPSFLIKDLYEQIDGDKVSIYREAAEKFFTSKANQEKYGFKLVGYSGLVLPTERHYTLRCSLMLAITDVFKVTVMLCCLVGLAVVCWVGWLVARSRRSSKIYNYLKECVMTAEDKTLNISLARADLQTRFGAISNEQWDRIDGLRASDKKIAYFEDDFLYWKAS